MAGGNIQVTSNYLGTGVQELKNLRLHQYPATAIPTVEGTFWWDSNAETLGGSGKHFGFNKADSTPIFVPRLDIIEQVKQPWDFQRSGDNPPFTAAQALSGVGSTNTMVVNLNSNYLKGYLPDAAANVSTVALRDSSGRMTCQDPVGVTDCVNLRFLRANLRDIDNKGNVRAATVAALPSYTFTANVITASANGALPAIDGITMVAGDRIAIIWEGSGSANYYLGGSHALNGIYTVTTLGDAGTKFVLTRAVDADVSSEITAGAFFFVSEGTRLKNSVWSLFTDNPIHLRTDAPNGLSATPAAGGTLSANTYYYKITLLDMDGGESGTSLEISGTTAGGNLTLALAWSSYSEAASYKVYRSTTSGSYGATSYVGTTTGTTFNDTGIALTTGTPSVGTALQWGMTGSNTFYAAGNGIDITGTTISVILDGSTTFPSGGTGTAVVIATSATTLGTFTSNQWGVVYMGTTNGISATVAGTLHYTLHGNGAGAPTWGLVDLTTDVTGLLPNANGGAGTLTGVLKSTAGTVSAMTGATNRVTFWSDANTLGSDANLTWTAALLTIAGGITLTGAQTIQSSTGVLTIATGGGNGQINISPNGTGNVAITSGYVYSQTVTVPGFALNSNSSKNSFVYYNGTGNTWSVGFNTSITIAGATEALRITDPGNAILNGSLSLIGAQSVSNTTGILTVTGTGGLTLTSGTSNTLLTQNSVNVFTSEGSGAVVNTLYLKQGNLGIGAVPNVRLVVGPGGTGTNGEIIILNSGSGSGANAYLSFQRNSSNKFILGVAGTTNDLINGDVANDVDVRSAGGNILFSIDNGTTANLYLKNNGNFGIGTTAPGQTFTVQGNVNFGNNSSLTQSISLNVNGNVTATGGIQRIVQIAGTQIAAANNDTFTGLLYATALTNGGSYTGLTNYCIYISNPPGSGTIATNYGLYLESQTRGTTNYAIYSAGGTNYFGGNVGIGTTGPTALLHTLASGSAVAGVTNVSAIFQASSVAGTSNYVSIVSGTTGAAALFFGDTAAQGQGMVFYDNSVDTLTLYSAAGAGLSVLNTAGYVQIVSRLCIGSNDPAYALDVRGTSGLRTVLALTDDTYDIGASAATRFKNLWLTGSIELAPTTAYNASPAATIQGRFYTASGGGFTPTSLAQILMGKENATDGNTAGYMGLYTRVNGGSNTLRVTITSTGLVQLANLTASTMLICDASKSIISGPALPSGATAARVQKITITGDGSTTAFTVTHNLVTGSTAGPLTQVWDDATKSEILVDAAWSSTNAIIITFVSPPANAATYTVWCVA